MPDYTFPVFYEGARISSDIGTRVDPISGKITRHGGIDIAAPRGSPVVAPTDITITRAEMGSTGGFGNVIYGADSMGNTHIFGHLDTIGVHVGDMIPQGMQIGGVGSTGKSTGNHLHYEVRDKKGKSGGGLVGSIIKRVKSAAKSFIKCGPNAACIAADQASEVAQDVLNGDDSGSCGLNPMCYLRNWLDSTGFIPRSSLFIIGGILIVGAIVFLARGMVPGVGKVVQ